MTDQDPECWRAVSVIALSTAAVLIYGIYIWWQVRKMRTERSCQHQSWSVREKITVSLPGGGTIGMIYVMECAECGDLRKREIKS